MGDPVCERVLAASLGRRKTPARAKLRHPRGPQTTPRTIRASPPKQPPVSPHAPCRLRCVRIPVAVLVGSGSNRSGVCLKTFPFRRPREPRPPTPARLRIRGEGSHKTNQQDVYRHRCGKHPSGGSPVRPPTPDRPEPRLVGATRPTNRIYSKALLLYILREAPQQHLANGVGFFYLIF